MANTEREITIYARVGEPDRLSEAVFTEQHEQWEKKLPPSETGAKTKMRIRQTVSQDGKTDYTETFKVEIEGAGALNSVIEETTDIDESYFAAWRKHMAEKGSYKKRYVFKAEKSSVKVGETIEHIPGVKYEVDILMTRDGKKSRWCKIDVEIDGILEVLDRKGISFEDVDTVVRVSHLPFKPEHCFLAGDGVPEHEEAVSRFWEAFNLQKPVDSGDKR